MKIYYFSLMSMDDPSGFTCIVCSQEIVPFPNKIAIKVPYTSLPECSSLPDATMSLFLGLCSTRPQVKVRVGTTASPPFLFPTHRRSREESKTRKPTPIFLAAPSLPVKIREPPRRLRTQVDSEDPAIRVWGSLPNGSFMRVLDSRMPPADSLRGSGFPAAGRYPHASRFARHRPVPKSLLSDRDKLCQFLEPNPLLGQTL